MGILGSAARLKHILTPSTPVAGESKLYVKDDNGLYLKSSDGLERPVWQSASPWITYTPVWTGTTTNPVLNNGTITGRYRWTSPDTVEYEIEQVMGSTTTYGSGSYRWSLPVNVHAHYSNPNTVGTALLTDSGSRYYAAGVHVATASTVYLLSDRGASMVDITPTSPHTWASTDRIFMTGSYQTASSWAGSAIGYSPTVIATAAHLDPDFELVDGNNAFTTWSAFWGNGTRTVTGDTTTGNVRSGTRSMKAVIGAASDQRILSSVFDVPANAVVRNSVWVKAAAANTPVSLGCFYSDSGDPEPFGGNPGEGNSFQEFVIGTDWQKITYTKACPPSTRRFRQQFLLGASCTVWFDQSESEIISGGYSSADPEIITVNGTGAWAGSNGSKAVRAGRMVTLILNLTTSAGGSANVPATVALPAGWQPGISGVNLYFEALDAGTGGTAPGYILPNGQLQHVFARGAGAGTLGVVTFVATA